jgi:hypothetical protein
MKGGGRKENNIQYVDMGQISERCEILQLVSGYVVQYMIAEFRVIQTSPEIQDSGRRLFPPYIS